MIKLRGHLISLYDEVIEVHLFVLCKYRIVLYCIFYVIRHVRVLLYASVGCGTQIRVSLLSEVCAMRLFSAECHVINMWILNIVLLLFFFVLFFLLLPWIGLKLL